MSKIYAIILAGGKGQRLKHKIPKQFIDIKNRPIIVWSLERFNNLFEINGIIIVIPDEFKKDIQEIILKHKISKSIKIVSGGKTRQESSYNALCSLNYSNNDILIFHDAARPFVTEELIRECILETETHGASGVYIKSIDSIAEADMGFIKTIPDRAKLYRTQTPQSFKYNIIREAHDIAISKDVSSATDDVQLVIDAGYKVKIIEGDYRNIKITTPFDLEFGRFIAESIEEKDNKIGIS